MSADLYNKYDKDVGKYGDIIGLPHYQSRKRPHMSNYDRAAQFAPFAALTGYEALVAEAGRQTESRPELSEEEARELDRRLGYIMEHIEEQPEVRVTWFRPDERKEGGAYVTTTGRVRRVDLARRRLIMADRQELLFGDILGLEPVLKEEEA